jgi:hypothetical protein
VAAPEPPPAPTPDEPTADSAVVEGEPSPGPDAAVAPAEPDSSAPSGVVVAEPVATPGTLRLTSDAGASATVVRIAAPSEIRGESIRSFRLESPPRFVVQVRGAEEASPGSVSSPLVRRIRIGVHPASAETGGQPEIHFVFDLADEGVRARASVIGGAVVVTFSQ